MKSLKLKKLIAATIAVLTIASVTPVGASAAWRQDSNGWWNTEGDSYSTDWRLIDGDWYYFDSVGYMKTGWVNDNGTWYYLQASGAMKTGWVSDKGTWYYLQASGAMKTGWIYDNGTWYYLQASGAMKTGWINDKGTWYFASSTGAMQTGVIQIDDKIYYFAPNGAMQTGTVVINGVTYTFALSGEAIGDKKPTPTLYFTSAGVQLKAPSDTTTTSSSSSSHHSSGGGSSSSSSGSNGGSNGGSDSNDITSLITSTYSAKLDSFLKNNPTLASKVNVTLGDPIVVTLLDSQLDSLQAVFNNAQGQDLSTIEARLTKAEDLMNLHSTMLSVNGVTFTQYLAKAETNYLANGGNSDYIKADGSFDISAIAQKIKANTLTYDEFKKSLEDKIIAMCDETKTAPQITVTDGNITKTVTKIEVNGSVIYNTSSSIKTNVEGLVSLGDTKGTYTIYCGTDYFTVKIA